MITWQQAMDIELKSRKGKKISALMSAIGDYQKSNEASKKFYASNYASWIKQLKKLAPEIAEYMNV